MLAVTLSAWVPPGTRVKEVEREAGMRGVVGEGEVEVGLAGRKRIRWSRRWVGDGIFLVGWVGVVCE